jgi:hypothetical protein
MMDRLAAARPEHLDPAAPVDEAVRGAELARVMAVPRQSRRARPRRVLWGAGLIGAATAAAVVAAVGLTGPAEAPARHAVTPVTLDARTVLLSAADRAYKEPAQVGAYYHTETLTSADVRTDHRYTVAQRGRSETWTPRGAGRSQWWRTQSLGAAPKTPADRAAWQQDGSPQQVRAVISKRAGTGALLVPMRPGSVRTEHHRLVDGDKVFWLGRNVTMKELLALPDTPEALKAWLLRSYTGHDTESSARMSQDLWLFRTSAGLITDMPVTAKVRGAAFRMLAGLRSVTSAGRISDSQGRPGVGITVTESRGVTEHRLIIDPVSGRALGDETIAIKPLNGLPAGSVISSTAVLKAGWTDTSPARD